LAEVRVVGGTARGRRLRAPDGGATRPTSDRVREAVFNVLVSMDRIEGAAVLDLFAGSGALGIESLSRGASEAVLVDDRPEAVEAIRENLDVLGADRSRARLVRADALAYAAAAPRFDLVLADPPYDFGRWPELLERLVTRADLLVAETAWERQGSRWTPGPQWETVKVKRYGGTLVSIVQPVSIVRPVGSDSGSGGVVQPDLAGRTHPGPRIEEGES
jgi:16S rRNA (guanine966-N2)-methyltransferase